MTSDAETRGAPVSGPASRQGRGLRRGRRLIGGSLLVAMVVYTALAVRFFAGTPNISRNFAAEFNAILAEVPEEQRAWPVYRGALLRLERFDGENWEWPDVPLVGPGSERGVAYLERNAAALELARRAAAMAVLGREVSDAWDRELAGGPSASPDVDDRRYTPSSNPPVMDWVSDHLGGLRRLSEMLLADARLAAARGEGDRVHADIAAMIGLAEHAGQHPTLMPQMMSLALARRAIQALGEVMGHDAGLMTEDQLEDLGARLRGFAGGGRPALALDTERLHVLDLAQRCFTDDGAGDGRVTLEGVQELWWLTNGAKLTGVSHGVGRYIVGPVTTLRFGSRKELVAEYDRLVGLHALDAAMPIWQRPTPGALEQERERVLAGGGGGGGGRASGVQELVCLLLPGIERGEEGIDRFIVERDAALVGIAAELHRRRTGVYPASGAELAAAFPAGMPPDWVDGEPLRYVVRDGRGVVYSLGTDADDDGGREPEEEAGWAGRHPAAIKPGGRPPPDGDWVLWPRATSSLALAPGGADQEPVGGE